MTKFIFTASLLTTSSSHASAQQFIVIFIEKKQKKRPTARQTPAVFTFTHLSTNSSALQSIIFSFDQLELVLHEALLT